jgi:hypothetical protein
VYNKLKSINIQNCIVKIDFIYLLKKHKNIKSTLFYRNEYTIPFEKIVLINYYKTFNIEYRKDLII